MDYSPGSLRWSKQPTGPAILLPEFCTDLIAAVVQVGGDAREIVSGGVASSASYTLASMRNMGGINALASVAGATYAIFSIPNQPTLTEITMIQAVMCSTTADSYTRMQHVGVAPWNNKMTAAIEYPLSDYLRGHVYSSANADNYVSWNAAGTVTMCPANQLAVSAVSSGPLGLCLYHEGVLRATGTAPSDVLTPDSIFQGFYSPSSSLTLVPIVLLYAKQKPHSFLARINSSTIWSVLFGNRSAQMPFAASGAYVHPTLSNPRMGSLSPAGGYPTVTYTF